jgi:hypothetical protein
MTKCKQYVVYYQGTPIENTGYFESVAKVREYLRKRYLVAPGMSFRAVYPKLESKFYTM